MEIEKLIIEGSEFTTSTLINYSSLIKLLSIVINKCNNLDNKLNALDIQINEKEKRLSNVEISLNINNDQSHNYISNSPIRGNSDNKDNKENISIDNIDQNIKDEKEKEKETEEFISAEKNKEKIELNYTMFSEMYKKVKDHIKFIKNIFNTLAINKKNEQENNDEIRKNINLIQTTLSNETKKLNDFMEKVNDKITVYDEDIDNLKFKLKDFNLYDIFKFQNLSPEIDMDFIKELITNLESKMNKKFILYDGKIKLINSELFKFHEEERNNNALISSYGVSIERIKKIDEELNAKYNNLSDMLNETVNNINNKFNILLEYKTDLKVNTTSNNVNEEDNKKFNKSDKKLNELIFKEFQNFNNKTNKNIEINDEKNKEIKNLKENFNNLEKYCKNNFSEINIKEINNRLLSLEKNNKNYLLYEEEIVNINDKNKNQDILIKEDNEKIESILQEIEQFKIEIRLIMKKLETLNYDITKLTPTQTHIKSELKSNNIDINKLVPISTFSENKKENSLRFEKIQKKFEELEDNIDSILNKLSHTPSDTDFSQFQDIIKNMIDNIVIKNKKQFANKFETVKSYKLLETKLNSMNDSYNKKLNHADNWLLAKKPLNSYQCASCESIIKGDLDQKNEFVAWNKYPYREENKSSYRMGHGFSHMLHMINEGLMKDNGESFKDEEKKKSKKEENNVLEKNKKSNLEDLSLDVLPKVTKKNHIQDLSLGIDSPLHNSRDIKQINKTIDNLENTPHIMKILKKNRSLVFKTSINNIQTEKPKNSENIKYINFIQNDKDLE